MNEPRYIVTEAEILNAVKWALGTVIDNEVILMELMKPVEDEISTILEDDCEEYGSN